MIGRPPRPPLFPSTTLFRSHAAAGPARLAAGWPRLAARQDLAIELQRAHGEAHRPAAVAPAAADSSQRAAAAAERSEEHTSELQSHLNLVCRLLLEKKKTHP